MKLHFFLHIGNEAIVRCLVEHGADINRASQKGETPLLKACEIGNEAIVKCLVEHGAYVNKADYHGYTPSFCVCESGNEDLVIYLVELGTDINSTNYKNETPLYIARHCGNEAVAKYLVKQGATSHKGLIPLFKTCSSKSNIDVIFELYDKNMLTMERLEFILKDRNKYLDILSSNVINRLIKFNKVDLLDFIFSHLLFCNEDDALQLLFYYKNKKVISTSDLDQQIKNFKILISTEYISTTDKYFINECNKKNVNLRIIK